jgi:3-dehydrotetronate 4-kinase
VLIGAVADDITGATDLCLMLSRAGMSVVQVMGLPDADRLPETDAVVIALKSLRHRPSRCRSAPLKAF